MDGLTLGLTIGGIVIGATASYLASRHFFRKGEKKKNLVPFVQFTSKLFSELDPELKQNLVVNFKNHQIENITQSQFLIANTGDLPIRDIIDPLRLTLPKENKIFNVTILHIEPEGRIIKYQILESDNSNVVEFDIPLLNAGDFFVVKLLIQDSLPKQEQEDQREKKSIFDFSITADDLPPKLTIERLPFSYYETEKKERYDWTGFWIVFISLIIFLSILGTIYSLKFQEKGLYLFSFSEFFNFETFGIYNICIILLAIIGLVALLTTVIGFIGSVTELRPNEKPKFKVPGKLRKERIFHPFEIRE